MSSLLEVLTHPAALTQTGTGKLLEQTLPASKPHPQAPYNLPVQEAHNANVGNVLMMEVQPHHHLIVYTCPPLLPHSADKCQDDQTHSLALYYSCRGVEQPVITV